jgi:hypothetical protein
VKPRVFQLRSGVLIPDLRLEDFDERNISEDVPKDESEAEAPDACSTVETRTDLLTLFRVSCIACRAFDKLWRVTFQRVQQHFGNFVIPGRYHLHPHLTGTIACRHNSIISSSE